MGSRISLCKYSLKWKLWLEQQWHQCQTEGTQSNLALAHPTTLPPSLPPISATTLSFLLSHSTRKKPSHTSAFQI